MPATNKIIPAMEGRNAKLVLFQDGQKKVLDFTDWTIKPNVTKHADGVNGEDRDRLSVTLNFYELAGNMINRDLEVLSMWLEAQVVRDAKVAPLDQQGALRFYPNNGTKKSFVLVDLVVDDFDLNQGGRATKIKTGINGRCTDLKEAKTL